MWLSPGPDVSSAIHAPACGVIGILRVATVRDELSRQRIGFSIELWQCQAARRFAPGLFDMRWGDIYCRKSDEANCVSCRWGLAWGLIVTIAKPKWTETTRLEPQARRAGWGANDVRTSPISALSSIVNHDRPIVAKKMRQPYAPVRCADLWRSRENSLENSRTVENFHE